MTVDSLGRLNDRIVFVAVALAGTFAFTQQALKLQRVENDRRLSELNNEASRLKEAVAANVSSDTWRAFQGSYADGQDRNDQRHKRTETTLAKLSGALILVSVVVPLVVYALTKL